MNCPSFLRTVRAVAAILAVIIPANGANATTENSTVSAEVLQPIVISEQQALSFGSFEAGANVGSVIISTGGTRSSSGDVNLGPTVGTQAQFDIAGTPSATISIGSLGTINLTSDGNIMVVNLNASGAPTILDGSGQAQVNVGATLTVPAGQAPGNYSGSFTVTVSYN